MSFYFLLRSGSYTLIAALAMAMLASAANEASAQTNKHAIDVVSADTARFPRGSTPAVFFTINEVLGRSQPAASISATSAAIDASSEPRSNSQLPPGPFGLVEFRAPSGELWAKWHTVESNIEHDLAVMARCRSAPEQCASPAAEKFNALIDEARRHAGRERLASVNAAVNHAIRYTSDFEQYGVSDLWSAPLATFTTERGDCEDYAIAKYVALRQAGVAADGLQLLLVRDQAAHEDHAVVAARQDGHWLILDNRFTLLPEDSEMWNFEPLYAIDQDGVQLLAQPYDSGHVADANTRPMDETISSVATGKALQRAEPEAIRLEAGDLANATQLAA